MTDVAPDRPVPGGPLSDALLSVRALRTESHVGDVVWRAVGDVSFEVRAGEAVGLVGESGSGKTVTALSIAGLVASPPGRIAGGSVRFKGQELIGASLADLQAVRGDRIAYVFQDPLGSLNPRKTIRQILEVPLHSLRGMAASARRARVGELMRLVSLRAEFADRYPHEFSGGQCQRIGIARALSAEPEIIVLDEPVSALDVSVQAQVLRLLQDLQARLGVAYLFISHDLAVVEAIADTVAVMHAGRIVERGEAAQVFLAPQHAYTRELIGAIPGLGGAR